MDHSIWKNYRGQVDIRKTISKKTLIGNSSPPIMRHTWGNTFCAQGKKQTNKKLGYGTPMCKINCVELRIVGIKGKDNFKRKRGLVMGVGFRWETVMILMGVEGRQEFQEGEVPGLEMIPWSVG